ncbi:UTP--glucose-1-phosphate uridylyltransferase, partial [Staphylococcus aureus]|nr:UTP--glucose-1-phosphate uridylyltransferase [Staphylococcus aureus]
IESMNNDKQVYSYDLEGELYDVGEKLVFVKTTIEYALKDDIMREELTRFIYALFL